MRFGAAFGWAIFGSLVIVACGSDGDDSSAVSCMPGGLIACTGDNGCSGERICNGTGDGYGDCTCEGPVDSGTPKDSGGGDSAIPNDAGEDSASDSGAFTPTDLSNLIVWVNGSTAQTMDGGGFSSWTDLTTNHNDFVIQTGAPTLLPTSTNGLPGVRFNIENDSVHSPLATYTATTYVISIVTKVDSVAQGDIVAYSGNTSIGGFDLSDMGALDLFFAPSDGTSTTITNAPHVLTVEFAATHVTLRVDGNATAALTSNAPLGLPTNGGSVRIGGIVQDVSELVMAGDTTSSDVTHIESYLKSKYGL